MSTKRKISETISSDKIKREKHSPVSKKRKLKTVPEPDIKSKTIVRAKNLHRLTPGSFTYDVHIPKNTEAIHFRLIQRQKPDIKLFVGLDATVLHNDTENEYVCLRMN